jgi:hypothetical protein
MKIKPVKVSWEVSESVDWASGNSWSIVTAATTNVTPFSCEELNWGMGVVATFNTLMKCGICSARLAELLYTAGRVFEHNLQVRARQHRLPSRGE